MTHPPRNAPIGFRSGSAAAVVSFSILDDRKLLVAIVCRVDVVAGFGRARSEGVRIREAIAFNSEKGMSHEYYVNSVVAV